MRPRLPRIGRRTFLAASAVAGLSCAHPFTLAHRFVQTNRYRIPVPRLPEAFRGFTVAQVTDLHLRSVRGAAFLERIVERTNALGADLVAVTGDYVLGRGTEETVDAVWRILAGLAAPAGVPIVLGNHDYGLEDQAKRLLRESGRSLHGKVLPLRRNGQTLWLAGAGDFRRENLPLDPILRQIPKQDCRIVLAHNPDTADAARTEGVDLFLSGHTHGGQVCIPGLGSPVLPVRNKTYSHGLKRSRRGEGVFICRGVGWSILPVRFLCPPEVAILELVPAESMEQA